MAVWDKGWMSRERLRNFVGSMDTLAGCRRVTLTEGWAKGVEAIEAYTGPLRYTVLPDRGLDVAWLEYKGIPLAFMGKQGVTHPAYYDDIEKGWLRSFYCGALTTCGLLNAGLPSPGHGLHGRISNIPATGVTATSEWVNDEYRTRIQGKMVEAVIFGENMTLTRSYESVLGGRGFTIRDRVENCGGEESPMMLMYHMNFGYPLLSPKTQLLLPSHKMKPRDDEARKGEKIYRTFGEPIPGYKEQVYFHDLATDALGNTGTGLWNEALDLGIALYWNKNQLPFLTQWKQIGALDYVCGIEPGNSLPEGQAAAREAGRLQMLAPDETHDVELRLEVLDGAAALDQFNQWLATL